MAADPHPAVRPRPVTVVDAEPSADSVAAQPNQPPAPPITGCRPRRLWLTAVLITVASAAALAAVGAARTHLGAVAAPYAPWSGHYGQGWSLMRWMISDTTEAGFAKSALAGVLMVAGAGAAHWAFSHGKRWQGFAISSGSGLFVWVFTSAALGLVAGNLMWGWTIAATGVPQPTFVAFVSVPPALVMIYGRGWTVTLTAAVLGAVLTTPLAILVVNAVCRPWGLPDVVGATTGMWSSALIAFALCRVLPWMPPPSTKVGRRDARAEVLCGRAAMSHQTPGWLGRRILADFTEAQFYGNEWASAAMLLGILVSFALNPLLPYHGSGLTLQLLTAQILTATLAVTLWRRRWARHGWYPTFVPVVSIAPATVLAFGGTPASIVAGAVLGAGLGPPLAAAVARRLPRDFNPFIANTVSMALGTTVIVIALGLLPGFHHP
jgi:hypothetical protein